jgi:hypothetical protein
VDVHLAGLWHLGPENLRKTGLSVCNLTTFLGQTRQASVKLVTMFDEFVVEHLFHLSVEIRAERIRSCILGSLASFDIACHYYTFNHTCALEIVTDVIMKHVCVLQ